MSRTKGKLKVGTSGYQYDHWRGEFYPDDLPKRRWFEHYAEHFDTVEINNTFYRLPEVKTFARWREAAPPGFCFAVKFSRFGTHMKKLKDPAQPVGLFLERSAALKSRMGPVLVQLPPDWGVNVERLDAFLAETASGRPRLRWAVEMRDESWLCDEVYDVMRKHDAALCVHDLIDDHPRVHTADWTYLRFHGPTEGAKYAKDYPHQALSAEARRIRRELDDGLDVYAYFNNDAHAHAVRNAMDLRRYVEKR